jgi:hypothetical protein
VRRGEGREQTAESRDKAAEIRQLRGEQTGEGREETADSRQQAAGSRQNLGSPVILSLPDVMRAKARPE